MDKRKKILLLLSLAAACQLFAQAPQATSVAPAAPQGPDQFTVIMFWVLGIVGLALFVIGLIMLIRVNYLLTNRLMHLEAARSGAVLPAEKASQPDADDFWIRLRKKYWENPLPIEREGEITFEHTFDGIRELDNRLPPWWVNLFLLTIFWSVGYMYFYHWGGDGPSSAQEYQTEMEQAAREKAVALAGMANAVDESSVTVLTDAGALGEGELIFKSVCAACHGQKGEGTVGPNMTDEYWIHGGGIKNMFKVIKYGVPEKGMISWQAQLKPADMQKVASYILTLQGTNPPNAKAPQGEIWKEAAVVQDTSAAPAGQ